MPEPQWLIQFMAQGGIFGAYHEYIVSAPTLVEAISKAGRLCLEEHPDANIYKLEARKIGQG